MAKGKKKTPKTKGRKAKAPAPEVPDAAAEAEAVAEAPEAPEVTVALLEAEVASLRDQLLRALAETENLRRRSQREREDVARYAAAPMLRDLLGVADNLRRALESVPPEAAEDSEQLKTLLGGVELTEKELQSVFARHHVVKIDPLGDRFDPHSHEAMFEVPDPNSPAGTIVQVLQSGYRLFDRLLRAAQVGVAKGGSASAPKAPPEEAAEDDDEAPAAAETAGESETAAGEAEENDLPPGSRVDTTA